MGEPINLARRFPPAAFAKKDQRGRRYPFNWLTKSALPLPVAGSGVPPANGFTGLPAAVHDDEGSNSEGVLRARVELNGNSITSRTSGEEFEKRQRIESVCNDI